MWFRAQRSVFKLSSIIIFNLKNTDGWRKDLQRFLFTSEKKHKSYFLFKVLKKKFMFLYSDFHARSYSQTFVQNKKNDIERMTRKLWEVWP